MAGSLGKGLERATSKGDGWSSECIVVMMETNSQPRVAWGEVAHLGWRHAKHVFDMCRCDAFQRKRHSVNSVTTKKLA